MNHSAQPKGGYAKGKALAAIVVLLLSTTVVPGVTLAWDAVTNTPVSGYRLYWGAASGSYTDLVDAGNATSVTVSGLSNGVTYYFAATAYTTNGAESAFSSEVSFTPGATNLPAVMITSPADNAIFTEPANIALAASVNPNGHTINELQFYNGSTLLGQSSVPPYTLLWSNVVAGSYTLQTEVVYDGSNTITSPVVNVTVTGSRPPGGPVLQLTLDTNRQAQIKGTGQSGAIYDVLASQDLSAWIVLGSTTADSSGAFSFIDSTAPAYSTRFYRARQTSTGGATLQTLITNSVNQIPGLPGNGGPTNKPPTLGGP